MTYFILNNMELHYYIKEKESTKYQTWFFDEGKIVINRWYCPKIGDNRKYFKVQSENHDELEYQGEVGGYCDGWTKLKMPTNLTKQQQLEWMIISNKEDLYFIMKEKEACAEWMMKHMDEILEAQKENKKIKQFYLDKSI